MHLASRQILAEPEGGAGEAQALPDHAILHRAMALLALVVFVLPTLVTALAVWWSIGKPLLFRQVRSGLGGRTFTIVKFRTMHDTRDETGRLLPDEARTTGLTRLIRSLRIDEIPQLFAVLSGNLALVGPRPLLPVTIESFGPLGKLRGAVRPGITGWAQVSGNTLLSNEQKLALDVWYVDHRSRLLDAQILIETVGTVFMGERVRDARLKQAVAYVATRTMPAERQQQRVPA